MANLIRHRSVPTAAENVRSKFIRTNTAETRITKWIPRVSQRSSISGPGAPRESVSSQRSRSNVNKWLNAAIGTKGKKQLATRMGFQPERNLREFPRE